MVFAVSLFAGRKNSLRFALKYVILIREGKIIHYIELQEWNKMAADNKTTDALTTDDSETLDLTLNEILDQIAIEFP